MSGAPKGLEAGLPPVSSPRKIYLDKSLLFSGFGVTNIAAIITSLIAGICLEIFKGQLRSASGTTIRFSSFMEYHEFTTFGAFVFSCISFPLLVFRVYTVCRISPRVISWTILISSAFWTLMLLISSCVVISYWKTAGYWTVDGKLYEISNGAYRASAVLGLTGTVAYAALTVAFGLDVSGVWRHRWIAS